MRLTPGASEPIEFKWMNPDGIPLNLVGFRATLAFWNSERFNGEFMDDQETGTVLTKGIEIKDPHKGLGFVLLTAEDTALIGDAGSIAAVRWSIVMESSSGVFVSTVSDSGSRYGSIVLERLSSMPSSLLNEHVPVPQAAGYITLDPEMTETYATLRGLFPSGFTGLHDGFTIEVLGGSSGQRGLFFYDANDATSPDDDALVIVDNQSRRWKRQFVGPALVRWFGAIGDGVTDDKDAWKRALQSGYLIDGENRLYAIGGKIDRPSSIVGLQNARFVQIAPTTLNARLLFIENKSGFSIRNVKIDMGGEYNLGSIADYGGLWISGSSKFSVEDVEVFNGGPSSGIKMIGCTGFTLSRAIVRDFLYNRTIDPIDDCITGIHLSGCSKFSVIDCSIHDLIGYLGGDLFARYTRGVAVSDCEDGTISGTKMWNCDQPLDMSGTAGSRRMTIQGCQINDAYSNGFKFAHANDSITVVGCTATDCGNNGFVMSGNNDFETGRNIKFIGCVSARPGTSAATGHVTGRWPTPSGFLLAQGEQEPSISWPRGITLVNCTAYDDNDVPVMAYCFRNQPDALSYDPGSPTTQWINELQHCQGYGFTVGYQQGFHKHIARVRGNANQTLTTGVETTLSFNLNLEDTAALHSTTLNPSRIVTKKPGTYLLTGVIPFAPNATGIRRLHVFFNGAGVSSGFFSGNNQGASEPARISFSLELPTTAPGDYFEIKAYQNSGGDLDVQLSSAMFCVSLLTGS
jgi:hypothetical protein